MQSRADVIHRSVSNIMSHEREVECSFSASCQDTFQIVFAEVMLQNLTVLGFIYASFIENTTQVFRFFFFLILMVSKMKEVTSHCSTFKMREEHKTTQPN